MRRTGLILLIALLLVSLAGNAMLGWVAWTAQTLAKLFVKTRQDLVAAKAAAVAAPGSQTAGQVPAPAPAPAPAAATGAASSPAPTAPPASAHTDSVAAIRTRYAPKLEAAQASCEGQLNEMLESAKAEYTQAKAAGTVDVAALGARYIARADGLRRQCDRQVAAITSEMTRDLRAAGLPLDLVDEVQAAYETRIIERQAEIMAKAPGQ
jgi:hypothetical protein